MAESHPLKSIVSIHDLMPETLDRVLALLEHLETLNVTPVTLLVVPGRQWTDAQLLELQKLQQSGYLLAGHGWRHEVEARRTAYHFAHSLVLSRMAAEHLSKSEQEIKQLVRSNHQWFLDHDFEAPGLYVPPAWAMGLRNSRLNDLPFDQYEIQSGVYNAGSCQFIRLTMAGYEADTRLRATFLRAWNYSNEEIARISQTPLRIGIHPYDQDYALRKQIDQQLHRSNSFLSYQDLLSPQRQYS